jgi:hypothetical protein
VSESVVIDGGFLLVDVVGHLSQDMVLLLL